MSKADNEPTDGIKPGALQRLHARLLELRLQRGWPSFRKMTVMSEDQKALAAKCGIPQVNHETIAAVYRETNRCPSWDSTAYLAVWLRTDLKEIRDLWVAAYQEKTAAILDPTMLIPLKEHVGRHRRVRPGHLESVPLTDDDIPLAKQSSAHLRSAETYMLDGHWEAAYACLADALELRASVYGQLAPESVDIRLAIAELNRVMGRRAEALREIRELSDQLRQAWGGHHVLTIEARLVAVRHLLSDGLNTDACREIDDLFQDIDKAQLGEEDELLLQAREIRSEVYLTLGPATGERAVAELRDVMATRSNTQKRDHADVLRIRSVLADAFTAWKWFHLAVIERQEILDVLRKTQKPVSPMAISAHNDLCRALDMDGRYKEAEEECRRLLHDCEKANLAPGDPQVLMVWHQLAGFVEKQGQLAEAEKYLRILLNTRLTTGDRASHQTALVWTDLAENLVKQEKWELAAIELREASRVPGIVIEPRQDLTTRLRILQDCIEERTPPTSMHTGPERALTELDQRPSVKP